MDITVDIIVSTISLVFASTIVGVSGMLAFVGNLPDKLRLTTMFRGAVALVFVIPTLVCVGCAMFGGVISLLEGCSFDDGFRFVISTVCGLGNPLTTWSPSTAHASAVNVVLGVAAQGLIGVIIGIAGGITPIVDAVERFDIAFGDTDAVEAISPDETADAGADKERGLDRAPPTGVLSP